jgi:hypothetical protein
MAAASSANRSRPIRPNLFPNRDHPVLTDYRAMFAGLFQRMFGLETASVQRVLAGIHPAELGLV